MRLDLCVGMSFEYLMMRKLAEDGISNYGHNV